MNIDDEDVTLMLAIPPIALFFSLSTNWLWINRILPRCPLQYYPQTIVIDERECGVRIHSGRLWIDVWSKRNEWVSSAPWWVRGISFGINPFELSFNRHEVRRADGSWVPAPVWKIGHDKPVSEAEVLVFPYTYNLKNGAVQNRIASVTVERRAWRPLCLKWSGFIEKVRTTIEVSFDDEVGEGSGSWKGGTTGCGYGILPGESAEQCLRRMEKERTF